MTEPELTGHAAEVWRLDEIEAAYQRATEKLRQAETDYLQLLEQADEDRAAALADVADAQETAARVMADAAALLDRAEHEAHRVRESADLEAAAIREQARNEHADAEVQREQARSELADVAARRERAERLQQAAAASLAEAERSIATSIERREQVEQELAEAIARRDAAETEAAELVDEAVAVRRRAAEEADRLREDAKAEAALVHAEAAEAMAAIDRLRNEHEVLRHSLDALPRPRRVEALAGDERHEAPIAPSVPTAPLVQIPPRLFVVALAIVVLCSLGAYMVASLGEKVYGGRVEILVDVPSASSTAERQLATQRVLIQSQVVMGAVAADEGVSVDEVERSLDVVVVGASEVLRLTVGSPDPEIAQDRAQAIADRYIALIEDTASAGTSDGLVPEGVELTDARLIAPARVLDDPIAPRPLRAAAAGAMAGMFLGGTVIGVHVLLQRWRRSTGVLSGQ